MFFKNELCGVQKINIDGDKRFLFGQICNGAEFVIGSNGLDVWCEGFCTGMAAHKALSALKIHARVHIAFSANNLLRMAKKGFVIADNDSSKTGEQVAIKTGLKFYMPPEIGTDFCDFWKQSGTLKAGMALKKAMM
jgi:putative DNA primase/helicase